MCNFRKGPRHALDFFTKFLNGGDYDEVQKKADSPLCCTPSAVCINRTTRRIESNVVTIVPAISVQVPTQT